MRIEDHINLFFGLGTPGNPPYFWTWEYENAPGVYTYEMGQAYGIDCSRSHDACLEANDCTYVGNTMDWKRELVCAQPYPREYVDLSPAQGGPYFLRGTFLVNGEALPTDHSHMAMVSDAPSQELMHSRGYPAPTGISSGYVYYVDSAAQFEVFGYHPDLGVDLNPIYWPGWFAHPALIAVYMARVANEEYGTSGVFPVACSMQEVGGVWEPGADPSWKAEGYWSPVDSTSLGAFQQKPDAGWGTGDDGGGNIVDWSTDVRNMDHALRAFLDSFVLENGQDVADSSDAEKGSEMIANVQGPREDLRGAYAQHFDAARALIAQGRALIPYRYVGPDEEVY